jgi:iron-sulfur cluster repair protein YtfE (RIC family)
MSATKDCPNCENSSVTTNCTVEAAIAKTPVAAVVFNAFGIDTCCAGRSTVAEAAARARVSPELVIAQLERARALSDADEVPAAPSCGCGCNH